MPTARTSVFISYSHADDRWRKLVEKHLAPLARDHKLRIWSDQNLEPGEPWLARIKRELATAKVGILLVSANFMASGFIHSDELPPLLTAAKKDGATLLSVMVGHCHFANSPLSKLQAFNKPDKPLSDLTPSQRDKEMARLCAKLLKLFGLKPGIIKSTKPAASVQATPAKITKANAAALVKPKRVTATTANNTAADEAATKAKGIAKRKAIVKNKLAAAAKKLTAEKAPATTKNPAAKKSVAKPTTTRAPKK